MFLKMYVVLFTVQVMLMYSRWKPCLTSENNDDKPRKPRQPYAWKLHLRKKRKEVLSFLFEDKKQSVIYSLPKHRVHCQSPKEIHAKNNNIWKAFLWPYTATKWNSIACIHNPPLCMSCCYQVPHLQTPMREIGLVFSVKMVRTRI